MSVRHAWQMFFSTATSRHTIVSLNRPSGPAFHRNDCIGALLILHSFSPNRTLIMRTYGFGPRHVSHTIGKSRPTVISPLPPCATEPIM